MCSRISWCIGRSYFTENFLHMCNELTQSQKKFIKVRYIRLLKNLDQSTKRSALFYYIFSGLVTTGSIIVPSLISIQDKAFDPDANENERSDHANNIYWTVWGISIMVTFSNAFIKLLRLDQTYISRNLRLNQLKSEGILFVTKTGDYDIQDNDIRFNKFVECIEKLKNLQMHQEFIQNAEFERNPHQDRIRGETFV